MSDLAAALAEKWGGPYDEYMSVGKDQFFIIEAAARERLRLNKVPCETCEGTGIAGVYSHIDKRTGEHLGDEPIRCDACNGSGEVWPAELVRILTNAREGCNLEDSEARAVLDAVESWMEAK